jgi:hypothetical protein
MRTTIDIADDVLLEVKEIAARQKKSTGSVVSNLLRDVLQSKPSKREYHNGVPLLPRRSHGLGISALLVKRLRDEDE